MPRLIYPWLARALTACAMLLASACGPDGGAASEGGGTEGGETGGELDPLDEFFSLEAIHTLDIEIDDLAFASLLEAPKQYVEGAVTVDGAAYEGVGVRLKGSAGSFVPLDGDYPEISGDGNGNPGKSAFIVDFNRYAPGQDHLGLEKLTINNLVRDPSGLNEYLGYALFRAGGVPASRAGFAMVSLNGEVKGLYALIESQDNDELLTRWFGSDHGNLYEGQYGTDLAPGRWQEFDQDNGADTSKQDLQQLSDALAQIEDEQEIVAALQSHFDLEAYLAFAVTEIYLGHWDGYVQSANNYAIHHDLGADQWTFMPWGIDQLFRDEMGPYAGVMWAPGPSWGDHGGVVHQLCMGSIECRSLLHDAFLDLFARVDALGYAALAGAGRALIEDQLYAESSAHGDPELTASALEQIDAHMTDRRAAIEPWLPCLIGGRIDRDGDLSDDCDVDCDPMNPAAHPGAEEQCNFIDDDCNGIVDDPVECPDCLDFEGPGGAAYLLCLDMLNWTEARQRCVDEGGDLASFHDPESAELLAFALPELIGVEEAWIGLSDGAKEGEFVWSDGSALDFERWSGEAPAAGPEGEERDCVSSAPWGWMDLPCAEPRAHVCLLP